MANNAVFIDTSGWVALANRAEARHREATQFYARLHSEQTLTYTSDYVLDELITLLFRRVAYDHGIAFVEALLSANDTQLRIETVNAARFDAAWRLRRRYQDKLRISFTDLTSMVIMNEIGITNVLTADEHFTHVGMGFTLVPQ